LYQCDDKAAPETKTSAVKSLCTITGRTTRRYKDLEDLLDSNGVKMKNKKKLEYTLEMVPSGSSVDFTVIIDGERQGSQTIAIQFEREN
jgi:hypothetical protein